LRLKNSLLFSIDYNVKNAAENNVGLKKNMPKITWPHQEAKRLRSLALNSDKPIIFETGYGPSGLPPPYWYICRGCPDNIRN